MILDNLLITLAIMAVTTAVALFAVALTPEGEDHG